MYAEMKLIFKARSKEGGMGGGGFWVLNRERGFRNEISWALGSDTGSNQHLLP